MESHYIDAMWWCVLTKAALGLAGPTDGWTQWWTGEVIWISLQKARRNREYHQEDEFTRKYDAEDGYHTDQVQLQIRPISGPQPSKMLLSHHPQQTKLMIITVYLF